MKFYSMSDGLFMILTIVLFWGCFRSSQHPFNKVTWHKFIMMPQAQVSLAVIAVFWLLGLLDCLHDGTMATVLDRVLYPLGEIHEYSYSKPFAWMSLQPQITMIHHQFIQEPQHLVYVAAAIKGSAMVLTQIKHDLWPVLWVGLVMLALCQQVHKAYRPLFLSVVIMMSVLLMLIQLSKHFHIMGTGQIGQDIFYQSMKSIRTGLMIGLFTSMIILPLALSLGLIAGYFGGLIDYIIQYCYTVISSIPSVLFISAILLAWQFFSHNHFTAISAAQEAETRLLLLCLLLGLTNWASLCRYIRAEVMKLRELDYIKAAKLLHTSRFNILYRHLLPNMMHLVIISLVLDFSALVLAESVLTYIGIGVSPLTMSWGNMINAARLELARIPIIWWPLSAAFSMMFILVLACNVFADALRKALNPRE